MPDALHLLRGVARAALSPSRREDLDQWADRHRVIAPGTSPEPGRWSTDRVPYLRQIMQACSDPRVRQVTVMKGSQLGVTEVLVNHLLRLAECDPAPALVLYPNETLAAYNNTERFIPAVRACPQLMTRLRGAARGGAPSRDLRALQVQFDRMAVAFVGSNSTANLESRPVRDLLIDELDADEFDSRAFEAARQRQKAFSRRKTIVVSKPSIEGRGVDAQHALGDRRRYFVPCPRCGVYQVLRFAQVRYARTHRPIAAPRGGPGPEHAAAPEDLAAIEADAVYRCAACRADLDHSDKPAMLADGVWLPARLAAPTQTVAAADMPELASAAQSLPDHASFQLGSLYSPFLRFGYVARVFAQTGYATRPWVNGELGEPWVEPGQRLDSREVVRLCRPAYPRGDGHQMITTPERLVPAPVRALFAGVDLQRDSAYAAVWGLSEYARDAYLVWFGRLPLYRADQPGVDLTYAKLERLLAMRLRHADGLPIGLSAMAVDSGDGQRTKLIYDWVVRQPAHVFAAKGRSGLFMDLPWERKQLPYERDEAAPQAQPNRALVRFLTFNTDLYKGRLADALQRSIDRLHTPEQASHPAALPAPVSTDAPGAAAVGQDMDLAAALQRQAGLIYLPEREDDLLRDVDEFVAQVTAEQLVTEKVKSGRLAGRVREVWKLRPGRVDNHYLDATCMALALADALAAPELLTPERWAADREARRRHQDLAAAAQSRDPNQPATTAAEPGKEGLARRQPASRFDDVIYV